MEKENMYIKTLLERFFEGQTSNEEEQQLYLFFSSEKLPEEWARYKPVFTYFESGLANELEVGTGPKLHKQAIKLPVVKKRQWVWGSIAASVALILFSSVFFLDLIAPTDPYKGSYIVRNGVRITDLKLIKPQLEAAIQKSIIIEQQAEEYIEHLCAIDDSQEVQILQRLQEYNQQILDNIQDEHTRMEVEKVLNQKL